MKNSQELVKRAMPGAPAKAAAAEVRADAAGYVSFGGLGALLWRRKWVVAACLALGLAAGVAVAVLQKPVYRALATIEIQIPNDDYLNRRQLDPSLPPGVLNFDPYLQTEMKRLTSDSLLWSVATDLKVAQAAEFQPKPGKPALQRGALLEALRSRLVVRLAGQTQVVELTFEANDARLASNFVNKLVETYRAESSERRRATAGQSAALMEGQLKGLETNLDAAQARLQRFVRSKGVMSGLDREGLAEARLRQLQAAQVVAQEARIAEEARFHETVATLRTPGELDNESLAKLRIQLTELERRRAEAVEVYQPAHYKVRQIEAEIAAVRQSLEAEKNGLLRRMKTQMDAAASRERNIAKDVNAQAGVAAEQVASEVEFTSLKHEVDGYQQLVDTLQQKVREARLAAAVPSSTVLVLDRADVPFEPVRPKRMFLVAIGGFCGLILGLLAALGSASTAQAQEAPRAVAPVGMLIPHLASVPRFEGVRGHAELGSALEGDSAFSESFRRMVTRTFTAHAHVWPRILVVSGLEPERGRTTVAVNLAVTLAKEGQNVLLVDADRMSQGVQMHLGIRGGRVLMAAGETGTQAKPLCAVWTTAVQGLSLVRLEGAALDSGALQQLEADFDAVIVDAPVLAAWPEQAWAQRFADGMILVASRECLAAPGVNALLAQLAVPVLGSVVNAGAMVRAREIA